MTSQFQFVDFVKHKLSGVHCLLDFSLLFKSLYFPSFFLWRFIFPCFVPRPFFLTFSWFFFLPFFFFFFFVFLSTSFSFFFPVLPFPTSFLIFCFFSFLIYLFFLCEINFMLYIRFFTVSLSEPMIETNQLKAQRSILGLTPNIILWSIGIKSFLNSSIPPPLPKGKKIVSREKKTSFDKR